MKIPFKQYWALLVKYVRPYWPLVLVLAVLLLANTGLQLVNPQVMRRFIDAATSGGSLEVLYKAALLFIVIAFVQQLTSVAATYVGENVGWLTTNALRADVAEHCLHLDMSFHNAHTPGEMIERVDGDINALSNFFSQFVIQVFGNVLLLIGVLVMLFYVDWRLGLTFAAFVAIALYATWRLRDIAVPHWKAEREASAEQFGFLEERLAGTEDIRSCGAKDYVMRRFYELMRDVMRKALKAGLMVNIMVNTTEVLFAVGNALALALGAYLYLAGEITIGTVFLIGWYATMIMRPIQRITWQMQELQRAGAGIVRVRELLGRESRLVDHAGGSARTATALSGGALAVEFQGVSFGYDDEDLSGAERVSASSQGRRGPGSVPDGKPVRSEPDWSEKELVLHGLSFRLEPGTVLGLLGRTGSGKTTLTRLLFRLYDPDSGSICIGSSNGNGAELVDLRQLPLAELRRRVGMVTQNIQLFNASVRDNLTFFDPTVSDAQILGVLRELGLWEWYSSLPEGLDTELESGGGGLSAGEAQLLAFTRIFLQDPGLVILDEASSRLDPATEHLIERAVDRLTTERTAIIIAHRLRTVQRADEIMILDQGRTCEYGPRSELANDHSSRFYSLLQTGLEEVLA